MEPAKMLVHVVPIAGFFISLFAPVFAASAPDDAVPNPARQPSFTETVIVDPQDLWFTHDRSRPMLTMFACHPKRSSRYRIVVTADLVRGRRIA